jgi:membrane protein YqaA with SNARE-associated domain
MFLRVLIFFLILSNVALVAEAGVTSGHTVTYSLNKKTKRLNFIRRWALKKISKQVSKKKSTHNNRLRRWYVYILIWILATALCLLIIGPILALQAVFGTSGGATELAILLICGGVGLCYVMLRLLADLAGSSGF